MSKKEINNLTEAFQALDSLNEDVFNMNNIEDVQEAQSIVYQNLDDLDNNEIDVIDTEAEEIDDLKDSYKDQVIEECSVCHSRRFIDPEDVVISEDSALANVGDECEYCHSINGYQILGKVEPYEDEECESEEEISDIETKDDTKDDDKSDEEKEEINLDGDDFTLVIYKDRTDKKSYADPLEADSAFAELKELSDSQLEEQKILGFARITRDDEDKLVIDDVIYAHVDDDCEEKVNSEIDEFIERKHDSEEKLDLDSEDEEVIEDTEEYKSETEEIEDETEKEIDESLKSKKLDDIDADMDDKKEKAKKVYSRKIDDADADRDERISRAKVEREKSIDDADSDRDYHLRKHDMKEDKTSLRDRIDAEADDKKELAKKRFARTLDDADADRDDKKTLARKRLARAKDDARADRDYRVKKLVKEDFNELADLQHDVDYEMETIKHISPALMNKIKRAGLSLVKDQYGEYEVIDKVEPVHENIEDRDIEVDLETGKPIHEKINKSFSERHPEMREHKHLRTIKENNDFVDVYEASDKDYESFDFWHDYVAEDEGLYGEDERYGLIIDGGRDFKSLYFVKENEDAIKKILDEYEGEEALPKLKEITGKDYAFTHFKGYSQGDIVDVYYPKDEFTSEYLDWIGDAYMGNYRIYLYPEEENLNVPIFVTDSDRRNKKEIISEWIDVPAEKIRINKITSYTIKPNYEIDESKKSTKRLHKNIAEDFDKVEIETKDQRIKIESEPICEPEEECGEDHKEVIAPIDSETADKFNVVDVDIDEIDEESSDEIIESYLKRVYENVKSYKTIKGLKNDKQIKLEGTITFKSGKQAKTNFIFESYKISKNNKLEFLGENRQFTRGKKAFKLIGDTKNGKLVCESLIYDYTGKDSRTGKSQRVKGRILR